MIGRSRSPTGPFMDRDGKDMVEQGGSLFLASEGRFIGPGHASISLEEFGKEVFSFHFYDGENQGKAFLELRELQWEEGWPQLVD